MSTTFKPFERSLVQSWSNLNNSSNQLEKVSLAVALAKADGVDPLDWRAASCARVSPFAVAAPILKSMLAALNLQSGDRIADVEYVPAG